MKQIGRSGKNSWSIIARASGLEPVHASGRFWMRWSSGGRVRSSGGDRGGEVGRCEGTLFASVEIAGFVLPCFVAVL